MPFEEWHGEIGCLLVHGFPGSPAEVREWGAYLAGRGISVAAPLLPGHGERPEALRGVRWEDWLRAAAADLRRLRERCEWVFAGGLSFGAALSLYLAAQVPLSGVIAVSPAVKMRNPLAPLLPVAQYFLQWVEIGEDSDLVDPTAPQRHWYYTRAPAAATAECYQLLRLAWRAAPRIDVPVLIVQSPRDAVLRPEGAELLHRRLGSEDKRLVWLERSGHNALVDSERERVFRQSADFIQEVVDRGVRAGSTTLRRPPLTPVVERGNPAPFAFERGPVGCLLLHGFPGSPAEMRLIGDYLAQRDVSVLAPLLPGHGTVPEDLRGVTWCEWVKAAQAGLQDLAKHSDAVFICGLSLGGALALYLAADRPVTGVVALAPAVRPRDRRFEYAELLGRLARWIGPSSSPDDLADPQARALTWHYRRYPGVATVQVLRLVRAMRRALVRIEAPTLVIQSQRDGYLDPAGARWAYEQIPAKDKTLIWLQRSGHNIAVDVERKEVFAQTYRFIARVADLAGPREATEAEP